MSIAMMIYLADVCNSITYAGVLIAILCIFIGFAIAEEVERKIIPAACFAMAIIFLLIALLAPSSKTIYAIAAVKYGEELAGKPEVKLLGDKVYQVLSQKLDEMIEKKGNK